MPPASTTPPVYPGCAVPTATHNHVWYIDADHGSDTTGNGSAAAPWQSLQAVVTSVDGASPLLSTVPYRHHTSAGWVTAPNPSAPIKPGDEILLRSGNYGAVSIGAYGQLVNNPAWITVAAAPGQTPVLTQLSLTATNHWVFNGLEVQSVAAPATVHTSLVTVTAQGPALPTSNIVFENMTLSSQDDVRSWTQAEWRTDGRNGLDLDGGPAGADTTCVSVSGSHIFNVKTGVVLAAGRTLFTDNQVDHFGDDGIDYAASALSITHNYVHDNNNIGDANHEDAMQGQIGRVPAGAALNHFSDIVIDSNTIIRQTDPHLEFPTILQGISAFDEDWTSVRVSNNVVITSACWGIGFASIHDSLLVDNTVLADGLVPTSGGCKPGVEVADKTHEGPSSTDTVVRNNLATGISVDNLDPGVEADHNVDVSGGVLFMYVSGKADWISKPGTYASGNLIDTGAASEFVDFDPSTLTYDVKLRAGAPAIGAGAAAGAPPTDITGAARHGTFDAGAY